MMAPGVRDFHLSEDVTTHQFTVSARDGFIPVYGLFRGDNAGSPKTVVVYYHGGGLKIGEADSEELSCRRILKEFGLRNLTVYSIDYRLMSEGKAAVCLSDSLDAFNGLQYIPEWLRPLHTTAWNEEFETNLLRPMKREIPRDGLERMPLEAGQEDLRGLPPHWVQLCTNDMLYSDGICYVEALHDAGVEVRVDVVEGWPHTFWLVAPPLQRALEAEHAMLEGLRWLGGEMVRVGASGSSPLADQSSRIQ